MITAAVTCSLIALGLAFAAALNFARATPPKPRVRRSPTQ
jgi:hypothetical protein